LKEIFWSAVRQIAPTYYAEIKARRGRAHSERLERQWGCSALTQHLIEAHGPVVRRGPFVGLVFPEGTHHRHLAPKLIGAYECELHPFWEHITSKNYRQIIDVGAAEGYYAVGLAQKFPDLTVHAFDTDPWAREMTGTMARANRVDNLSIHRACTPTWLRRHLQAHAFILSDCEGYEDQLFVPDTLPVLNTCDLLIELHEEPAPGVTDRLTARLEPTHRVRLIDVSERSPQDYPELKDLPNHKEGLGVREYRPDSQQWLYAEAR